MVRAPGTGLALLGLACNPPIPASPEERVFVDSDGDTYADDDESFEGTDPLDPASRIYHGYWPYRRDKNVIADPGWASPATVGGTVPRFEWIDQFGDAVDVYDFSGHGRPVVLEMSAGWCRWCHEMALWLGGGPSAFDELPEYAEIPDAVADGRVLWITVLDKDAEMQPVTADYVEWWYETYPNPRVPVLADSGGQMVEQVEGEAMPRLALVDANMQYMALADNYAEILEVLRRYLDAH